jgi:hypothetical protein
VITLQITTRPPEPKPEPKERQSLSLWLRGLVKKEKQQKVQNGKDDIPA